MKNMLYVLSTVIFFLACQNSGTEPNYTLDPPVLLPPPDDLAVDERGLDAVPEYDAIQVEWMRREDVTLYLYRRAETEKDFSRIYTASESDSIYLDRQIELNRHYDYFLIADDGTVKSEPSDTLGYKVVAKAYHLTTVVSDSLVFYWQLQESPPDVYVLKLYDDFADEPVWFSQIQSSYSGLEERVGFNWDSQAWIPELKAGHRYRWRVDIVGPSTHSGSESAWQYFLIVNAQQTIYPD